MVKIAKHKINFAEKNLKKKRERIEKMNMKPIGFVFNVHAKWNGPSIITHECY